MSVAEVLRRNRIVALCALVYTIFALLEPTFTSSLNQKSILQQVAADALVAGALTVVLVAGQIDLSIGSTLALTGMAAIGFQDALGPWGAIAAALGIGAAVGLVNGMSVVFLRINSLIVTLATMIAVRGIALAVDGGNPVASSDPLWGLKVDENVVWVVTWFAVIAVAVLVSAQIFLSYTRSGRNLVSAGGSMEASRLSGIKVDRAVVLAFVLSGLMCGVAGTLVSLRLATGSPVVGQSVIVIAAAAAIIGGASLFGGEGNVLHTLFGVLLLVAVANGLDIAGFEYHYQQVVIGAILLVVVVGDTLHADGQARARAYRTLSGLKRSTRYSSG